MVVVMALAHTLSIRAILICGASVLALSACGGGSSNSGGLAATSAPPPNTRLSLQSPANVRTQLTGTALRGGNGTFEIADVTGTFDHSGQALVLNDGQFNFADSSGPNAIGLHQDGSAFVELTSTAGTTFDFVIPYAQSYILNGRLFDSVGVVGLASNPSDIPSNAKATFNGFASGAVGVFATQQTEGFIGDSTVAADFGNGQVDLTLDNLTTSNGARLASGFDEIRVDNMIIRGNAFDGGTLTTRNNGAVVNVTGTNTVNDAQGHFFGPAGSAPDEAAGTVTSVGDTRLIGAVFVAD